MSAVSGIDGAAAPLLSDDTQRAPALSIRQPWAWLIVHGFKDVENRDWPTRFRGSVFIHAGKTITREYYDEQVSALARMGILPDGFPPLEQLPRGGIVGRARIIDCVRDSLSPWYVDGSYAFVLRDAEPLPFMPIRGQLGFFDVRVAKASAA